MRQNECESSDIEQVSRNGHYESLSNRDDFLAVGFVAAGQVRPVGQPA